jgi:hypothetical protein
MCYPPASSCVLCSGVLLPGVLFPKQVRLLTPLLSQSRRGRRSASRRWRWQEDKRRHTGTRGVTLGRGLERIWATWRYSCCGVWGGLILIFYGNTFFHLTSVKYFAKTPNLRPQNSKKSNHPIQCFSQLNCSSYLFYTGISSLKNYYRSFTIYEMLSRIHGWTSWIYLCSQLVFARF